MELRLLSFVLKDLSFKSFKTKLSTGECPCKLSWSAYTKATVDGSRPIEINTRKLRTDRPVIVIAAVHDRSRGVCQSIPNTNACTSQESSLKLKTSNCMDECMSLNLTMWFFLYRAYFPTRIGSDNMGVMYRQNARDGNNSQRNICRFTPETQ